ncbi:MAG: ATP-dependent RecD-like DNA helicase [Coxiellaceae bacterium]|jgi:exodeoxyribonuclease V alpha subunit|nr:ATP-dependent RecD-like DNA helicase [Coxiellaceae bacterium]
MILSQLVIIYHNNDIIKKLKNHYLKLGDYFAKYQLKLYICIKCKMITALTEKKTIRNIMMFLRSNGIGIERSKRIYKIYGDDTIDIISNDPYKLIIDIISIGFKTADILAMRLGITKNSIKRVKAGIRHILQEHISRGHCAIEQNKLIESTMNLLEISKEVVTQTITNEIHEKSLILDKINGVSHLFLSALYQAECLSVNNIERLKNGTTPWGVIDHEKALEWVKEKIGIIFSSSQQNAITIILKEKVTILTGGPGVGKSTIINCILRIVHAKKIRVSLCAPTGRAAKQLTENTGFTAKTIHRLLEYDFRTRTFKRNQYNSLSTDMVIIDEASMIDITLWNDILKSIPNHASLLIVGDSDQLPSVGPGAVLADMINSKTITVVKLTEIFRQAINSQITINAHRINQGLFPIQKMTYNLSDFYFIPAKTPEEIHEKLLYMITERIPKKFYVDPKHDIQILTPMNKGNLGSNSLNNILQSKLNQNSEQRINRFGTIFSLGDKIIQNINNYDKEVFNGDIGLITNVDLEEKKIEINFYERVVVYDFNELDEISLAYAISIHKSQGSEYPVVIIPIAIQHYMLLARNLLYTAVTRGKKLVVIIGQTKALAIAIKNGSIKTRITNLQSRLCNNNHQ